MNHYPISLYQKRFWLEWKLNPNIPQYNTPLIYRIQGNLNVAKLEEALSIFIHQYFDAALCYFEETTDGPIQKFVNDIEIKLKYYHIEHFKTIDLFIDRMTQKVFDLTKFPLFDFSLLNISDLTKNKTNEYILVLNFHHIITDALTAVMLTEKLSNIYNFLMHKESTLPIKPPKLFINYLLEQEKHYAIDNNHAHVDYWVTKLKNKNCLVELKDNLISYQKTIKEELAKSVVNNKELRNKKIINAEISNEAIANQETINIGNENDSCSIYYFNIETKSVLDLKKLARKHGSTVFLTLTALFSVLCHRYTEQNDIVLTYAVNMRPPSYPLMGSFVNMIPTIASFKEEATFIDILVSLTKERKEAKTYQHVILTDVIQQLRKQHGQGAGNFNIGIGEAFLYSVPLKLADLVVTSIQPHKRYAFNDLYFYYELKADDTIECRFDYRQALFSEEFISRFAGHFKKILNDVIKNPFEKIRDIILLTEADYQKSINNWRAFSHVNQANQQVHTNSGKNEYQSLHTNHSHNYLHYNDADKNCSLALTQDSIVKLFKDQVKKTPNQVAVRFSNQSITYHELDHLSDHLADIIQELNNSADTQQKRNQILNRPNVLHVGIYLSRGIEQVIAILAILKSNAIYVPLDINDPPARTGEKINQAVINFIFTTKSYFKKLSSIKIIDTNNSFTVNGFKDAKITPCSKFKSTMVLACIEFPEQVISIKSSNTITKTYSTPAYIMFTSGSTNIPKAVIIEQYSVINLILSAIDKFKIGKIDSLYNNRHRQDKIYSKHSEYDYGNCYNKGYKILSLSAIAFDIYGLELYSALFTGSQHIVCPEDVLRDPIKLLQNILDIQPNLIQATPTLWSMILNIDIVKPLSFPCTLLVGGEVLTPSLGKKLLQFAGQKGTVWNVYGPTETTIWSCCQQIDHNFKGEIGYPFANTFLMVLDKYQKPVPIGIKGELYIGGAGLATGYYNDDAETHKAFYNFIPSDLLLSNAIWSDQSLLSQRLYKTGDFVCWTKEDSLLYLGRLDKQIKIRGHRIEVAEIEHCFLQQPVIDQIHICVKDDKLFCFYTTKKEKKSILGSCRKFFTSMIITNKLFKKMQATEQLIAHLKAMAQEKLPSIMRPVQYFYLDKIPITITGKLDINFLMNYINQEYLFRHEPNYSAQPRPYDLIEWEIKQCWLQAQNYIRPSDGNFINYIQKNTTPLDESFIDIGGDSLSLVHLSTLLSDKFKMSCSVTWINQHPTILKQAEFIRQYTPNQRLYQPIVQLNKFNEINKVNKGYLTPLTEQNLSDRPLIEKHLIDSNLTCVNNIFLIHPALAGIECYDELSQYCSTIALYGIDSYNLNSGQDMITSIEELAKLYISYLKTVQPKGPYTLGGWSLGGIIAYEMAQILQIHGEEVNHLFLLDTHIYRNDYLQSTHKLSEMTDVIEYLPPTWAQYYQKLSASHLDKIFQSFKNDIWLSMQYKIKPYDGKVTLFTAIIKTNLTSGLIERKYNGWKSYIKDLTLIPINTTHYELIKGLAAKTIVSTLHSIDRKCSVNADK